MKDIFSELYKKVLSFFNNEAKEENSKDTACNRLKLVLMQDRAKMEPALMEKMREEMVAVISKYVEIDKEALDLNLEAEGESFALMLNIPVIRAKTREEVEEAEGIVNDDDDDDIVDNDEDESDENDEEDNLEENSSEKSDNEEDEEVEDKSTETETSKGEKIEMGQPDEIIVEADIKDVLNEDIISESSSPKVSQNPSTSPKKKNRHQKDDDL